MSTYSPDLRIELITTGDQAGTWGATTNTNLAYVVEQAIAGYVSVSVTSANQALTYINGGASSAAANQSVHAALALTTTTSAAFAVYAPPSSKQYVIYNASAHAATIYNSSVIGNTTAAGTGVVIPAGKTLSVWSDGTNFASTANFAQNFEVGGSLVVDDGIITNASAAVYGSQATRGNISALGYISTASSAYLDGASTQTVTQSSAVNTTTDAITIASAVYTNGLAVVVSSSGTLPTGLSADTTYYVVGTSATTYFSGTGYINDGTGSGSTTAGTVLTITGVNAGSIGVGTVISGTGVASGTTVSSLGTGTGGAGTYTVSASQLVASTTINGTYSGSQTIKLSTSFGGSAVNITNVGTGDMTLTPVSLGITAPSGTSTKALATCEFVTDAVQGVITAQNWEFDETSATQTATITIASPAVVTVASAPTAQTAVAFTTTGALPTGLTVNAPYYVFDRTSTTYKLSTEKDESQAAFISIAAPGVITVSSAPANGDMVNFTTTGSLPTGLSVGTYYFVVNRTSTTFQVATTAGGSAITTSGSQSGDHTAIWRTPVNTSGSQSGTQTENTSLLKLLYKNTAKMSIDIGGNMILAGSVTTAGTP